MKNNLIAFDMDGVLVDVSGSYRATARQTARLFFQDAAGASELPDPLFSLADLSRVKQSGGLNNDWDLTYLVVNLLFSCVDCPQYSRTTDAWQLYRETIPRCDIAPLAHMLKSTGRPLTELLKSKGQPDHDLVRRLRTGDVGSGNIIKQIFQEIYLGRELFESTYRIPAEKHRAAGYIDREKLMVEKALLAGLAEDNILAVATGRPRAEADYALDHFGLRSYFSHVLTLDDCLREEKKFFDQKGRCVSLSKPHPFMLDAIAAASPAVAGRLYYVGDMPDDMLAAKNSGAGFKGIGLLYAAPDAAFLRAEFVKAGADYIIDHHRKIAEIGSAENRH